MNVPVSGLVSNLPVPSHRVQQHLPGGSAMWCYLQQRRTVLQRRVRRCETLFRPM